jgi:hypothetical protein
MKCPRGSCGHDPGLMVKEMANKTIAALRTTRDRKVYV